MKKLLLSLTALIHAAFLPAQSPPWENPLNMAWSADGVTFGAPRTFQDSAGVPCVIRWKGDTLACVFQWFRQPVGSPSWDRVAVKFSYDNGQRWTEPVPIEIAGFPANYQRPFDPTIVVAGGDSLRIFYSSSVGRPLPGQDSIIDTHSAIGTDGVHYAFEPGPRVNVANNRVIDPAVIRFKNLWHYLAPVGAPQQGAFHFISGDGFRFTRVADIPSDNQHNWTGNYMISNGDELRFYGSGSTIWYNSSPNGGMWNGFVSTNVRGGDPGVVQVASDRYLMVYTGPPYRTAVYDQPDAAAIALVPNPTRGPLRVTGLPAGTSVRYVLRDVAGHRLREGMLPPDGSLDLGGCLPGCYFLELREAANAFGTMRKVVVW